MSSLWKKEMNEFLAKVSTFQDMPYKTPSQQEWCAHTQRHTHTETHTHTNMRTHSHKHAQS